MTDEQRRLSDKVLAADLCELWSRMTQEPDFPMTPDHCINGTRVAIEVLKALGARHVRPVSVAFIVFNRPAWELYTNGIYAGNWPEHAWSVGVHPEAPSKPGGWNGHLMCEGDGWTLDVSAQQFHRPGLIAMPKALWFNENIKPVGQESVFIDSRQQTMVVWRLPENNGWRRAPGWSIHADNKHLIETCIDRMRAEATAREEPEDDGQRDDGPGPDGQGEGGGAG